MIITILVVDYASFVTVVNVYFITFIRVWRYLRGTFPFQPFPSVAVMHSCAVWAQDSALTNTGSRCGVLFVRIVQHCLNMWTTLHFLWQR